jgi:hypothetical protein
VAILALRYSTDVKDALGAIGHQLRQREWSVREIGEMYLDAGFKLGEETLRGRCGDGPLLLGRASTSYLLTSKRGPRRR